MAENRAPVYRSLCNAKIPGRWLKICLILFLLVATAVVCAGCFGPYPSDFSSRYTYHLSLKTTYPVHDAAFLIPLPVVNGTVRLGNLSLDEMHFSKYRYYAVEPRETVLTITDSRVAEYPPDYQLSIITNPNGTFLSIESTIFRPEKPLDIWFFHETEPSTSYLDIDTIHPRDREPVFLPKNNYSRYYRCPFSDYQCFSRRLIGKDLVSQTRSDYVYDIPVYARYSVENDTTTVLIESSVKGENHWIRGYDLHGYNTYEDRITLSLPNGTQGWNSLQGVLTLADGDYPAEKASGLPPVPPEKWTLRTDSARFSPRINHEVVVFNNRMWIIGGTTEDGRPKNDVWYSEDGAEWHEANASAGFPARDGSCSAVFQGKMWIIGGKVQEGGYKPENSMYKNDIWYSSDGTVWSQAAAHAAFPGRTGHQCLVFNDMLWVIGGTAEQDFPYQDKTRADGTHTTGGIIQQVNFSDVWYSADGVNWAAGTRSAGFGERFNHRAAVYRDRMWVMNGVGKHDIWSSPDGITWVLVKDDLPFNYQEKNLEEFGVVAYDDKLWIILGTGLGFSSDYDVWYTTDGKSWVPSDTTRSMNFRNGHGVAVYKDRIWVIGGRNGYSASYKNDVWYTPSDVTFEPVKPP